MRVGVFFGEFKPDVGGGYTFVSDVAEAFFSTASESNHEFVIFCPQTTIDSLRMRSMPSNIEFVSLAERGRLGQLIARLKHVSALFKFLWPFPGALERMARTENIQMMWFVGGFFDTLDIPYIANVWDLQHRTHPWFPEVSAGGVWEYRELFLQRHLRRATRIITGTKIGKSELIDFYQIPENRIAILPHPTPSFALKEYNVNKDAIRKKFGLGTEFLLYPAQFWAHKNHMCILLALASLKNKGLEIPDIAFVGSDKGNRAYIEQQVTKLWLKDKIHCLGFVSVEDLIGLYKSAEAMIYASFSGPENLPPLEAFALGCPVIASDFPGAREQLGDAAIYFDPHDPESLAAALKEFVSDSNKESRQQKGYVRAAEWTGKDYVQGVLKLMNDFEHERHCWK